MLNQEIFDRVVQSIILRDSETTVEMLDELVTVHEFVSDKHQKKALKNIAKVYGLKVPGCLT